MLILERVHQTNQNNKLAKAYGNNKTLEEIGLFSPEMARFGRAEEVRCEAAAGDLNVVFNYLIRMQRETESQTLFEGV